MIPQKIIDAIQAKAAEESSRCGIHQEEEQRQYRAYCLDEEGSVVFLSKPYNTRHYCESALTNLQSGTFVGEIKEDEQGFFIEFKRDSGSMIGISPSFSSREAAETALAGLAPSKEQPKRSLSKEKLKEELPRHSFRIDLYPAGEGSPLRGRIEHTISQESASFQGLDTELIRSFLAKHLPAVPVPPGKAKSDQATIELEGQPKGRAAFPNQALQQVKIAAPVAGLGAYDVFVYAKSLDRQQQVLVGRTSGEAYPIRLRVFLENLPGGWYRLEGTLQFKDNTQPGYTLRSELFHLMGEPAAAEAAALSG